MIATCFSRLHLKLNASVFQVIFIYMAVLPLIINTSPGLGGHGNGNTFAVAAPLELAVISPRMPPQRIIGVQSRVPDGLGEKVFRNIDKYVDKKKRDEMFACELTSTSVVLDSKLDVSGRSHSGVWDVKYNDKPASSPPPDHTGVLLKKFSQLSDEIYAEVYALGERKELVASGKMKNSLFPTGAAPNSADAYSYVVLQWKYPGRVLHDIAKNLAETPNAWAPGKGKTARTAWDQWVGKTARKACKKVVDDAFADPKGIYHESNHRNNFLCVCADGTDCSNIEDMVKFYSIDWGKYRFIDKTKLTKQALFGFCLNREEHWVPKNYLRDGSFLTYPQKDSDI